MHKKITALWTAPRSRSTAFLWMISRRGDFSVVQELFTRTAYFSEERIFDRVAHIPPKPEYNYHTVMRSLKRQSQENRLFMKDFAYCFIHLVDDEFIASFDHTFLIRDPAQMLPSYHHQMPDLDIDESGYKEMFELFQKVLDSTGEIPPVVNADDLIENPAGIIRAYCSRIGIPFIPEALNWNPPGDLDEIKWWAQKNWYENFLVTRGFEATERNYLRINESDKLRSLYDFCMPYYENLNKYRLHVETK